jgi:N-succinyldiaminopimelate aminotransferase
MRYHEWLVNPQLSHLHPYPFERLRALFAAVTPPAALAPVRLSIGEPQHATPSLIVDALQRHMDGLAVYPTTAGLEHLRGTIAQWFERRYGVTLDSATQVLPVNGTREALFAVAQAVVDRSRSAPLVVCPNPFYQIYEGAALLAGAEVLFLNQTEDRGFAPDWASITGEQWSRTHLLYVCSPGNPTGRVLTIEDWREIFALSDRHGFVIASDECYSDIYDADPPLGALEAAARLGRTDYNNLVVFVSLSKRSNAPGMRSGAVAGDAAVLKQFLLYRTYHGSAMSLTVQHGSIAAWSDEGHVEQNRTKYRAKFDAVVPLLAPALHAPKPEAGFYLWARVPGGDDEVFARDLYATANVTVLPGQYLARDAHGVNPGRGYVRIALVPELSECVDAATRIAAFCTSPR